jgi:hypothetical protein
MSSAYATKIAEGFSHKLIQEVYDMNVADKICNREYEGEINQVGSLINMLNIARIEEQTYTKGGLVMDNLYENNCQLQITEKKSFYWGEYTIDKWLSYIKNPHSTVVTQKAEERSRNIDKFVLGKYADAAAGNYLGTVEATGTVSIAATTGVVTGSNTAFTEAMEGLPFKAEGHTQWYRVKDYTSATSITIEDDLDDVASQYTGGVIAGGATYQIQGASAVTITTSNLLSEFGKLGLALDTAQRYDKSAVPRAGRWAIVPSEFEDMVTRASGVELHVPEAYSELVKAGFLGTLKGFQLFVSNDLVGNNTDGFHVIAGHSNWMTFAEKLLSADIEEDIKGDFGTAYKDLFVYGAKVPDSRRHFAATALWKF